MRQSIAIAFLLAASLASVSTLASEPQPLTGVFVLPIKDTINPGTSLMIQRCIRSSEEKQYLLIIELNTPGGLLTSTRDIVSNILESKVPVVVYVSPSGAQAASAGMMVTIAAHFAAMAPGTNIGAAHPVAGTGAKMDEEIKKKAVNDTVAFVQSIAKVRDRNAKWIEKGVRESAAIPADEAFKHNVIDGLFSSRQELLTHLQTHDLKTKDGSSWRLSSTEPIVFLEAELREQFMSLLGNPNIAYMLLALGGLGIYVEMTHPGLIFPGVVGGISMLLGLISLQMLPVRWGAFALFILGFALLVAELLIPSFGFLGIGGIVSLLLGSLYLFDPSSGLGGVDFGIVLGVVLGIGLVFLFVATSLFKIRKAPKRINVGPQDLVGQTGIVKHFNKKTGKGSCFVHSELWNFSTTEQRLKKGDEVVINETQGFQLIVTKHPTKKPSA